MDTDLFIGGQWRQSEDGSRFDVLDPANGEVLASVANGSVADGILLVVTLMGWNYLVNALSYHLPFVEWLVSAPPLQVVRDGQLLRRNMRREFITEEELVSHLRQLGIDDVQDVKAAYVEGEGKITAVRKRASP